MSHLSCSHGRCDQCNGYRGVFDTYVCFCRCHDRRACECGRPIARSDSEAGCPLCEVCLNGAPLPEANR